MFRYVKVKKVAYAELSRMPKAFFGDIKDDLQATYGHSNVPEADKNSDQAIADEITRNLLSLLLKAGLEVEIAEADRRMLGGHFEIAGEISESLKNQILAVINQKDSPFANDLLFKRCDLVFKGNQFDFGLLASPYQPL